MYFCYIVWLDVYIRIINLMQCQHHIIINTEVLGNIQTSRTLHNIYLNFIFILNFQYNINIKSLDRINCLPMPMIFFVFLLKLFFLFYCFYSWKYEDHLYPDTHWDKYARWFCCGLLWYRQSTKLLMGRIDLILSFFIGILYFSLN